MTDHHGSRGVARIRWMIRSVLGSALVIVLAQFPAALDGVASTRFQASGSATWDQLRVGGVGVYQRIWSSAAFDATDHRMVLFGGGAQRELGYFVRGVRYFDEVLMLHLRDGDESWRRATLAGASPGERVAHAGAFDPVERRMIVFGGADYQGTPHLTATWAFDVRTSRWSQVANGGPTPTWWPAMVYDAARHRMILYGGLEPGSWRDGEDVWELDLSSRPTWRRLRPAGQGPPGRHSHSAVFDAASNRMVVFGGVVGTRITPAGDALTYTPSDDVWALVFDTPDGRWERLPGGPARRYWHGAAYRSCPGSEGTLIFGGFDNRASKRDTWFLGSQPDSVWTAMGGGRGPRPRDSAATVYDAHNHRMVIFGGWDTEAGFLKDVWALDLPCEPPATATPSPTRIPQPTRAGNGHAAQDPNALPHPDAAFGMPRCLRAGRCPTRESSRGDRRRR